MNSKYPSVRAESVLFLSRCFAKCTPTILNKTHMNTFITALTKTLNESGNLLYLCSFFYLR